VLPLLDTIVWILDSLLATPRGMCVLARHCPVHGRAIKARGHAAVTLKAVPQGSCNAALKSSVTLSEAASPACVAVGVAFAGIAGAVVAAVATGPGARLPWGSRGRCFCCGPYCGCGCGCGSGGGAGSGHGGCCSSWVLLAIPLGVVSGASSTGRCSTCNRVRTLAAHGWGRLGPLTALLPILLWLRTALLFG